MSKSYKFPSGIDFLKDDDCYVVKYKNDRKLNYELDIWAIAYALSDETSNRHDSIEINILLPSDFTVVDKCSFYLRHYFLKDVFPKVSISINGTKDYVDEAVEIISSINKGKFITYKNDKKGPSLSRRGTKSKLESQLEEKMVVDKFGGFSEKKRQWPANIFDSVVSKDSRKTRRRWIDMIAIDSDGRLSAVEIKAGKNLPLDLFVQNFDYMIYLHLFKAHMLEEFFDNKEGSINEPICGYFVTERMHPLLSDVLFSYLMNTSIFNFESIKYSWTRNYSDDLMITEAPSVRIGL